jgi:hypothetical protein
MTEPAGPPPGNQSRTYKFDTVGSQRRYTIPLLIALAVASLAPVVLIGISQLMGTFRPGRSSDGMNQFFLSLLTVGPIVFVLLGLPAWRKPHLRVTVDEAGISFAYQRWTWNQLDSLLLTADGRNTTITLFAGDQKAAQLTQPVAILKDFSELLQQKTKENWLPRMVQDFGSGKPVYFGNLVVSSNTVQHNGQVVPFADIDRYYVEKKLLILRRKGGLPGLVVLMMGLPNAELLEAFARETFPGAA